MFYLLGQVRREHFAVAGNNLSGVGGFPGKFRMWKLNMLNRGTQEEQQHLFFEDSFPLDT